MIKNMGFDNIINEFADLLAEKVADKIITKIDPKDNVKYNDDDLLDTPRAAAVLGLKSPNTLRNWTKKGIIPPIFDKISGKYYYKYCDLMRFKKNRL